MSLCLYAAKSESERAGSCVLAHMPAVYRTECPCFPCRLEADARAKREERRLRIERFKALLRIRSGDLDRHGAGRGGASSG